MKHAVIMSTVLAAFVSFSPAADAKPERASTAEAQMAYELLVDTYMHFTAAEWDDALKESLQFMRDYTSQQKSDIYYMRKAAAEYRPDWWQKAKSSSSVSFTTKVWGRSFTANYIPSEMLGGQQIYNVDPETGRVDVVVTWQPHWVDSLDPVEGDAAKAHHITRGDLAEAIIWHELGHNYVTNGFDLRALYELYTKYRILFDSIHEFYADMTALYHCSPAGRKATFLIRVPGLHWNDVNDPHVRGAIGVGSYLLATVLSDPASWPSFNLPTEVPSKDVERNTILYMYEHIDPDYTFEEDSALRELIGKFIRSKGSAIFRAKGTVPLPNKLVYRFTTSEDREHQIKRDEWVAAELKKAINAGLVQAVEATKGHPKRFRIRKKW